MLSHLDQIVVVAPRLDVWRTREDARLTTSVRTGSSAEITALERASATYLTLDAA